MYEFLCHIATCSLAVTDLRLWKQRRGKC